MTFDERLDRLAERHEALAQSVQMLLQTQREHGRQTDQLFGQVALRLREVTDSVDTLARIAGVHQERLDGHEQRLNDLEQGPHT
jgi:hypothetical protein